MGKSGPTINERLLAAAKQKENLKILRDKEDLQWLLMQPQFRRWATNHIYGTCMVNKTIWEPSAKIHLYEGRRSVGIDALTTFTKFPELYSQFEHERVEAELDELKRNQSRQEIDDA